MKIFLIILGSIFLIIWAISTIVAYQVLESKNLKTYNSNIIGYNLNNDNLYFIYNFDNKQKVLLVNNKTLTKLFKKSDSNNFKLTLIRSSFSFNNEDTTDINIRINTELCEKYNTDKLHFSMIDGVCYAFLENVVLMQSSKQIQNYTKLTYPIDFNLRYKQNSNIKNIFMAPFYAFKIMFNGIAWVFYDTKGFHG